jgi:hypothetical protein
MKNFVTAFFIFSLIGSSAFSQISPITFGAVSRSDLEMEPYPQEKGAEAVVLCDFASVEMIYDDGFRINYNRHVRIKIFKAAGLSQGNIQISRSKDDKMLKLEASTYNLDNDKVVEEAVKRKQIYTESNNNYQEITRFSFPNVRVGSVIEYKYTLTQEAIYSFKSFRLQRQIPVRHAEYWAVFPGFFKYAITLHGADLIRPQHTTKNGNYNNWATTFDINKWTADNMPAVQPEPWMPESDEYYAGVNFELVSVETPSGNYTELAPTFPKFTERILDYTDFSQQLNNQLLFGKKVHDLVAAENSPLSKMQAIYDHVKSHMSWDGYSQFMPSVKLWKAYSEQSASNAEINMILINMLRVAGISADPVVLCTRENGTMNTFKALETEMDYLVCEAEIEGKQYLLDATDKFRPMGMLPFRCMNKEGWVLNNTRGRWIPLLNQENYSTNESLHLKMSPDGKLTGEYAVFLDGYNGLEARKLLHNGGEFGFREEKVQSFGNFRVSDLKIFAVDSLQSPLRFTFHVEMDRVSQNMDLMLFFKPIFSLFGNYDNSWTKENRVFPVDLGCPNHDIYTCTIDLPDDLTVEELPKNLLINLQKEAGRLNFEANLQGSQLVIRQERLINKTFFKPEEYPDFRAFNMQVSRIANEMIVLKKNKL